MSRPRKRWIQKKSAYLPYKLLDRKNIDNCVEIYGDESLATEILEFLNERKEVREAQKQQEA